MAWIEDRSERMSMLLLVAGHESSGTASDAAGSPQSKSAGLLAWWVQTGQLDPAELDEALRLVRGALDREEPLDPGNGHSLERAVVVLTRAVELARS